MYKNFTKIPLIIIILQNRRIGRRLTAPLTNGLAKVKLEYVPNHGVVFMERKSCFLIRGLWNGAGSV